MTKSAAALHIHRSTLRYRLARIAELTGHDLRKVDTRFNPARRDAGVAIPEPR